MAVLLKSKDGHGWTTSVAFKWLPKKGRPNLDQKQIRPDVFEKTGSKVGKSVFLIRDPESFLSFEGIKAKRKNPLPKRSSLR